MEYYINQARAAEKTSDWRKAAELWRIAGDQDNSKACTLLAEATESGDAWRQRVLEIAGPEPEVEGDKSDSIKWNKWFKLMSSVK
jgi:TPR repeat protein